MVKTSGLVECLRMTSERQRAANRANSAQSTGPRTKAGKARSSGNARKHGLGTPASGDPTWSTRIRALADAFAGADALAHVANLSTIRDLALQAAAATADLERIAALKAMAWLPLAPLVAHRTDEWGANAADLASASAALAALTSLDRYERRALSRQRKAIAKLDAVITSATSLAKRSQFSVPPSVGAAP
jgi:hypothetical protein